MNGQGAWGDIAPRVLTGMALAVVGLGALWLGGVWFVALAGLGSALMIWELSLMLAPDRGRVAVVLGLFGALWVPFFWQGNAMAGVWSLLAAPLLGLVLIPERKVLFLTYGFAAVFAAFLLAFIRHAIGLETIAWLILVVVASDIGGYFAGRMIGGPKFWPKVSPKKTWSGTIAGWIGAGFVGWGFVVWAGFDSLFIAISPFIAFAAQMGDIAESAIKRTVGVKDSSNLLPGHGGVLDRFDGLIGAALVYFLALVVLGSQ